MRARQSGADSASRVQSSLARATITKINDGPKVQELDIEILKDETKTQVERFQEYGFSSVPLSPTGSDKAEAIVAFLGSHRSHAVIVGVDDRRHRPKGLKEGESQMYDDQGQKVHLSREMLHIFSKKKIVLEIDGGTTLTLEKGKLTLKSADIEFVKG